MSASQRFRWSMPLVTIISPFLLLLLEVLLHFAKALDRLARTEILELEELPDLDLAFLAVDGGIGKAPRPLHRFFPRLHLDDRVAGDELLRFGERSVDHGALRSRVLDAPALRARLQARGVEQHPGFLQLLVVLLHLHHELLGGHHARFRVLRGFDYHHESHAVLRCSGTGPPDGSGRMKGLALTVRRTRPSGIDTRRVRRHRYLFFFAAICARRRSSCSLSSGVNSAPKSSASNTWRISISESSRIGLGQRLT